MPVAHGGAGGAPPLPLTERVGLHPPPGAWTLTLVVTPRGPLLLPTRSSSVNQFSHFHENFPFQESHEEEPGRQEAPPCHLEGSWKPGPAPHRECVRRALRDVPGGPRGPQAGGRQRRLLSCGGNAAAEPRPSPGSPSEAWGARTGGRDCWFRTSTGGVRGEGLEGTEEKGQGLRAAARGQWALAASVWTATEVARG